MLQKRKGEKKRGEGGTAKEERQKGAFREGSRKGKEEEDERIYKERIGRDRTGDGGGEKEKEGEKPRLTREEARGQLGRKKGSDSKRRVEEELVLKGEDQRR